MTKMIRAGLQIKCNGKPEKEIALKTKQIKSHDILCKSLMMGEGGVGEGIYFSDWTLFFFLTDSTPIQRSTVIYKFGHLEITFSSDLVRTSIL